MDKYGYWISVERGSGWTGDPLVTDAEEIRNNTA